VLAACGGPFKSFAIPLPALPGARAETLAPGGEITGGFFVPAQVYPTNPQRSRQHISREQPHAGTGAPADCGAPSQITSVKLDVGAPPARWRRGR
jgi:hypothetical protein